MGIEPTHRGFADPGLTTWLRYRSMGSVPGKGGVDKVVESFFILQAHATVETFYGQIYHPNTSICHY